MAADARGCFLQFAKAPRAGRVKTRLLPRLSGEQAAAVAQHLTQEVARALDGVPARWQVRLCVDDPEDVFLLDLARQRGRVLEAQGDGDLGARMERACTRALAQFPAVIVVGSDCLGYDADYLHQAAQALEQGSDAVLGPAHDGGYVLVGFSRPVPEVFEGMSWGSDRVAAQQRQRFRELGVNWSELPPRADIDRPEDLVSLPPESAGLRRW